MQLSVTAPENPTTFADDEFVTTCIAFANWQESQGLDERRNLLRSIFNKQSTHVVLRGWKAKEQEYDLQAEALQPRIRAVLKEVLANHRLRTLLRRASVVDADLEDVAVTATLRLRRDGHVYLEVEYKPATDEAAVALLQAFLLDPRRPFGADLRSCLLDQCGRYFLALKNPSGGPRRKYCCDAHAYQADQANVAERVRRYRATKARKHK